MLTLLDFFNNVYVNNSSNNNNNDNNNNNINNNNNNKNITLKISIIFHIFKLAFGDTVSIFKFPLLILILSNNCKISKRLLFTKYSL